MKQSILARIAASTALAGVMGSPAFAAAATQDDAHALSEVIVTAERRETNIQTTPISITAMTAATIDDSGVKRVEDFANLLPNVYVDDRNLRGQNIAIRGISADLNNPGLDQGVGIFVDGVYLGRATGANTNLFNLERVEVLRGPQGTLYGKNAIAGAINYITRKPDKDFALEGDISYGNFGAVAANAMISGPVVAEKLFASFGGSVDERRGTITNLTTGARDDNRNGQGARLTVVGLPSDSVELIVRADVTRDRTRSGVNEVVDNGAFTGSPLAQPSPDTRTIAQNRDPVENRDTGGVSGELNWKVAGGTLTSLTAYRYSNWFNLADNDYTVLDILSSGIREDQRQVSQEMRFASGAQGPFNYLLGAYYFHQSLDTDSNVVIGPDLGVYPGEVNGDIFANLRTDSYAAFAHGNYRFNEQWGVTAGARLTRENKSVVQHQSGDPLQLLLPTTLPHRISRSENNVSPTLSLEYQPGRDRFFYLTFSQGYKSGGFNVFSITPTNTAQYAPEHVNNYEGGYKAEFLDRTLQLNASVYYLDYRNLQANQLLLISGLPEFQTSNAARARSTGAEITLLARPVRELTLSATYGYDDAVYSSYPNATSSGADYTGHALPRAPKNNASFAAQLEQPISRELTLFARGEASYRSRTYFGADNAFSQGAVELLNARLGLQSHYTWGAYLWIRNIGNVRYAIDREFGAIVPNQTIESIAAPRTFGVEIRARY